MKKNADFAAEMGGRIRAVRQERQLTIEKLAELSDLAPQYVSEVERGRKTLGSENLRAICLALGTSADFFLFGVGSATPKRAALLERLVGMPHGKRELLCQLLDEGARLVDAVQQADLE